MLVATVSWQDGQGVKYVAVFLITFALLLHFRVLFIVVPKNIFPLASYGFTEYISVRIYLIIWRWINSKGCSSVWSRFYSQTFLSAKTFSGEKVKHLCFTNQCFWYMAPTANSFSYLWHCLLAQLFVQCIPLWSICWARPAALPVSVLAVPHTFFFYKRLIISNMSQHIFVTSLWKGSCINTLPSCDHNQAWANCRL